MKTINEISIIVGASIIAAFAVNFFSPAGITLIVNAMLLVFIIALSINLIRGHEFDCGCFAINSSGQGTFAGPLFFRDFVLLALGLYILFYRNARKLWIL